MNYAVELVFNEEGQKQGNNIRSILEQNGIPNEAVPTNHISIADFKTDNLDELKYRVNEFSKVIKPFNVKLSMVGTFMTKENVIFLSPIMTAELKSVHAKFINYMKDFNRELNHYYDIDKWIAHCTIAIRLSDDDLIKGIKILKENIKLPIEVRIDKIDILKWPPPYIQEFITKLG